MTQKLKEFPRIIELSGDRLHCLGVVYLLKDRYQLNLPTAAPLIVGFGFDLGEGRSL
jgi:hypothetical protein